MILNIQTRYPRQLENHFLWLLSPGSLSWAAMKKSYYKKSMNSLLMSYDRSFLDGGIPSNIMMNMDEFSKDQTLSHDVEVDIRSKTHAPIHRSSRWVWQRRFPANSMHDAVWYDHVLKLAHAKNRCIFRIPTKRPGNMHSAPVAQQHIRSANDSSALGKYAW